MSATFGYALLHDAPDHWQYRGVESDWPLAEGEVFYESTDDFPQEAKDWFAAHPGP